MESVENTQIEIVPIPNAQMELLKLRIPYDEDIFDDEKQYLIVLMNLLQDSKYIALSIRFPFEDYSNMELPKKFYNWQLRCCVEIYQMLGKENIKSYSENTLGWTRDGGNISNDLKDEIIPNIGVIIDNDIEE